MPRVILKSPYLKPNRKKHLGNYVKYIATREGVEPAENPKRHLPALESQMQLIQKLLKAYPDCRDLHEHEDYLRNPTQGNAEELIQRISEIHFELLGNREKYVSYFLCSTNEFPLINQLRSESPFKVHHGYVNHTIKEIDKIPFPCGVEFTWDLIGKSRFLRHHNGFIPKNQFGWLRPIRITEVALILPNPTTDIILPDVYTIPASRER